MIDKNDLKIDVDACLHNNLSSRLIDAKTFNHLVDVEILLDSLATDICKKSKKFEFSDNNESALFNVWSSLIKTSDRHIFLKNMTYGLKDDLDRVDLEKLKIEYQKLALSAIESFVILEMQKNKVKGF